MQRARLLFILSAGLFLPILSFCQHCDSIPWLKHHNLKWKYFKAKPDPKNNAAALTSASIYYEVSMIERFAKFTVSCSFYPCKSWVRHGSTDRLLEHEQTHFDIAEYHKRLIMKEVMNRKFTVANVFAGVQEMGAIITGLRKEMDELYDLDTSHSINEKKQKEWTRKVDRLLKNVSDYDGSSFIIKLN